MTDKEFYEWFVQRIEKFDAMNICHPNSEKGQFIKLALIATEDRFEALENKIKTLEEKLEKYERPTRSKTWSV